jgi:hypothetical protein
MPDHLILRGSSKESVELNFGPAYRERGGKEKWSRILLLRASKEAL